MEIDKTSVIYNTAECSCHTKETNGSDLCSQHLCYWDGDEFVYTVSRIFTKGGNFTIEGVFKFVLLYICDTYFISTDIYLKLKYF